MIIHKQHMLVQQFKRELDSLFAESKTLEKEIKGNLKSLRYE